MQTNDNEPHSDRIRLVLVADGDQAVRNHCIHSLQGVDCQFLQAENGYHAYKLFQEFKNDILLMISDITMPIMDGLELYHLLRETDSDIRFLFLSIDPDACAQYGQVTDQNTQFICKPFEPHELMEKVLQAITI